MAYSKANSSLEEGLSRQPADSAGALALPLPESVRPVSARRERGRDWLLHRVLLVADVFGLSLAFVIAQALYVPQGQTPDIVSPGWEDLIFFVSLPVWVLIAMLSGLYGRDDRRADHSTVDDLVGVVAMVTIGAWIYSAVAWLSHAVSPNPPRMVTFWLLAIALVVTGRVVGRALARRSSLYGQNAVIVGAGDVGQLVARKIQRHPEYGINLVGFVDSQPMELHRDLRRPSLLGTPDTLIDVVRSHQVDRVIIAYSREPDHGLVETIHNLAACSVHIDIVPRLFDTVGPKVTLHSLETLPLLGIPALRLTPSQRLAKRAIDLVLASVALALVSPLFAYIAWRVRRDSPGPVFFRQERLGLNMRPFLVLKFRTMRDGVAADEHREYIRSTATRDAVAAENGLYKLTREDVVTPSGRWLRRLSLDELPQLINVLKGEMSLVGPRPCIAYETEHFASHHFERFLVTPGMTGLWQVAARARSSFAEALEMDVLYVRSWSLGLDLRLLARTPFAVFHQASSDATA